MSIAYQYDDSGYFAGATEDHGLLPNNATYTPTEAKDGFIPRWTGTTWEHIPNHKDREGYLNGQPHTIREYGPLPEGFTDTPPPPTAEELASRREAEIKSRLDAIDKASVRPLRAVAHGSATDDDIKRLAALDAEAEVLRGKL